MKEYNRMSYDEKLFRAGKSTQNGLSKWKKYGMLEKFQVTKELKRGKGTEDWEESNGLFMEGLMFYFTLCPFLSIDIFKPFKLSCHFHSLHN